MKRNAIQGTMQGLQDDMQLTVKRMELRRKGNATRTSESTKENQQPLTPKISTENAAENIAAHKTPSRIPKASKTSSSGRKIKPKYRRPAGYTWNKGGRLKEIRIRTRARKFLNIWKSKTFGRLLPSKADSHFKKHALKKAFTEWRTFWWEARVEWKLHVRAEYHHRYSLYSLIWLNWRQYTLESRENRVKVGIAETHWIDKVQKSKFDSWKLYIQLRRTKKSLYANAQQVSTSNRVKNTWKMWKVRFMSAQKAKHDNEIALLHWMASTQRTAWRVWSSQCRENIRQRTRALESEHHYHRVIVQKCFSGWLQYRKAGHEKQKLYDFAICVRNRSSATHCLLAWHRRWKRAVELEKKEYAIEELSHQCRKRRVITDWIHFVNYQKEKRRKVASAQVHHRRKLLKTSIFCWKQLVLQERTKASMLDTAMSFRWRGVLKSVWSKWQNRLDIAEDAKMTDLTKIAMQHFNTVLMQKMLRHMLDYVDWRRERAQKKIKAQAHFASKSLPFCFRVWKSFVVSSRQKTDLREKADDFRLSTLKMKYFYSWWEKFDQCRECRTLERIAFVHSREITLRSNFARWKQRASKKIVERRCTTHADLCYREILLKRSFRQWKELLLLGKVKRQKIIRAATYCYHNTLAGSWIAWRGYVQKCKAKCSMYRKAIKFQERNALSKCITSWKERKTVVEKLKALAVAKWKEKEAEILFKIFTTWRRATTRRLSFKTKLTKAKEFNCSKILFKQFTHWREWSAMHYHKRVQKEQRLNKIRSVLCRLKARRIFVKWREATVESISGERNMLIAIEHFKLKVCKVTFQTWKVYRYLRLKKALMVQQASHFHSQKLIRMYFSTWKIRLADKDIENKMEEEALWHWALTLQQKVLVSWIQYTQERKRKHTRYDNALQQRRLYLLRKGCRQILEHHSEIMHFKTKAGATARAHSSYAAYHLAWKFARKWREVVQQRRERRSDVVQMPKSTNLTFIVDKPMYYPISNMFPTESRKSQPELGTNWLPEPGARQAPLYPFSIPNVPSSPERSSLKVRPLPRGPDFLMDSLQREGLDEHVEFNKSQACASPKPAVSAPILASIEQEPSVSSQALPINQNNSYPCGKQWRQQPASDIPTAQHQEPEYPPTMSLGIQTTPKRSPSIVQASPEPPHHMVRFDENCQTYGNNFVLMPPDAFTCFQSGHQPTTSNESSLSTVESYHETSYSSINESFTSDDSQIGLTDRVRKFVHKGQTSGRQSRYTATCCQAESARRSCTSKNNVPQSPKGKKSALVASEIDQIKREMQSYQEKKENLKALKRQKEFLENWLVQQQSRSVCDSSIFVPAQDEIQQLNDDLRDLALEIQAKRPQIEQLIERVKALSRQPTQR